jgi:outer membrane immunogenic protein
MTLMKFVRTSVAALGALAVMSTANAADLYTGGMKDQPVYVPPPLWTGFYIGGNLGVEWANLDIQRNVFCDANVTWWGPVQNCANMGGKSLSQSGGFGGGQFGYNWQAGGYSNFVFGIEVDLGGIVTQDRRTLIARVPSGQVAAITLEEDGGFAGDVTGRLGYAFGNSLIYAKGGFAFFDPNLKASETIIHRFSGIQEFNGNNNNNTLTGWTIGAGWEYMLAPHWTIKVEYLHFDFSNDNNNCCGDNFNSMRFFHNDLTVDTVKLGFNYLWNTNYVPLK